MTRKMLGALAATLFLCSVGVVWESAAATDTTLAEIAQYRHWARMSENVIPVAASTFPGD